jgi:D-beta-D-heptose 7-phosphate kinase/D-beta-D-heptose 1-phosphate adenosyltransferase
MTVRSNLVYQVGRLSEACVLVVGDVMLDRFVYGEISRISPEAPVPVLKYGETKTSLGGAGNVVRNLHALGARVLFLTVLGDDPEGEELAGLLSGLKGIESRIIVERGRATTVKTRFIADRQQVLRLDKEKSDELSSDSRTEVFHLLPELISRCNVVLVSDYAKGTLSLDIPSAIISISKEKGKQVLVDPKGKDFGRYRGASLLTPNLKELSEATGLSINGDESIAKT